MAEYYASGIKYVGVGNLVLRSTEVSKVVVSKQSIRKCIKLICNGRLCDECPIEEECWECTHHEGVGYDTTIDEFLNIFKRITE